MIAGMRRVQTCPPRGEFAIHRIDHDIAQHEQRQDDADRKFPEELGHDDDG